MISYTTSNFGNIEDEIVGEVLKEARDLVVAIFERVVLISPVLRGHYRASWKVTKNELDESFIRDGGTEKTPLGPPPKPNVQIDDPNDVLVVSNAIPYAELIEHGYSQKAPSGVLSVVLNDLGVL